jgi:hypothetical protein
MSTINMEEELKKAQVLVEALPYIQKFNRKIIVVKYGGSAMVDEELTTATFSLQYNPNLLLHLILPCIVEHKYSAHCYYQGQKFEPREVCFFASK